MFGIDATRACRAGDPRPAALSAPLRGPAHTIRPALKSAARIRVPVLIAHGKLDRRVPIAHSEKMVAALKERGKEVQWMPIAQEGHGIFHEENQERFFQALFKLFDRTIGHPVPAAKQVD